MKLALAQMLVEPGHPDANLARAGQRIAAAAARGADAVLLPECLDLGWTHPSAHELATSIPEGESCRRLRAAARRHRIFVCAGIVERAEERLYNAAVLLDPEGRLLLHHRKIHELDFGRELYDTGDRLGVADTPFGRIGLMICADGFAPGQVISRSLALMGARVILSPCAWAVPADHDNEREPYGRIWLENYGAVCLETGLTIAGCSNVGEVTAGPWAGRPCIGCSLVISPEGQPLVRGSYGANAEELIVQEIPLR
jgi:predicted amidohydrolase